MPPPDYREINRLGRRLARFDPPRAEDIDQLGLVEARYVPTLEQVRAILRGLFGEPPRFEALELTITSRPLKTVGTIIDKLRREHTRLSTMQDIAGVRIVGQEPLTLTQQDRLVETIARRFDAPKIVDRRLDTSFGYRAVHIIPEVEGYPVEIQVRTYLQHVWADGMERMADAWGRNIRYGGLPQASDEAYLARRIEVVDLYAHWGGALAEYEVALDEFADRVEEVVELEQLDGQGLAPPGALPRARDEMELVRGEVNEKAERLVDLLRRIHDLIQEA